MVQEVFINLCNVLGKGQEPSVRLLPGYYAFGTNIAAI